MSVGSPDRVVVAIGSLEHDALLQRALAAEEAAKKATEEIERILAGSGAHDERHRLRGARPREEETHPLRGARPSKEPLPPEAEAAWWETFVPSMAQGIMNSLTPSSSSPSTPSKGSSFDLGDPATPKSGSKRRGGPRRLYPSGLVSLVPEDYLPPSPVHPIIWDGMLKGRQLNVKNFWKHFACFQPTEFNDGAIRELESLGRYRQPVWYSPLLASAAPIMVEHDATYTREEIDDGDGGQICVDWAFPEGHVTDDPADADLPTVVIFPGLAGHSQKDYIRSVVNVVTSHLGWRVCVLNWRGFNKAPISKKKVFRPDDIGDMQLAIESANKKHPAGPLFAVGYSAGSNQLVKFLGSHGKHHPVAAAVSVCNGFEYECHLKRLEQTTMGHDVYSRGMAYLHQEYLREHGEELAKIDGFDLQRALAATKHSELDEALVCSLYGYTDVAEYYRAIASKPFINGIAVPLLAIQSADDPLFTEGGVLCRDVLPVTELHDNENTIYFETELGSHRRATPAQSFAPVSSPNFASMGIYEKNVDEVSSKPPRHSGPRHMISFVEAEMPGGLSRHENTFCDRAVEAFLAYAAERVQKKIYL